MVRCFIFQQPTQIKSTKKKSPELRQQSEKLRLMLVRVFNVQVMFHQAETSIVGHRDKRRGRTGQQDIDKSKRFQDPGQYSRVLHRSVRR